MPLNRSTRHERTPGPIDMGERFGNLPAAVVEPIGVCSRRVRPTYNRRPVPGLFPSILASPTMPTIVRDRCRKPSSFPGFLRTWPKRCMASALIRAVRPDTSSPCASKEAPGDELHAIQGRKSGPMLTICAQRIAVLPVSGLHRLRHYEVEGGSVESPPRRRSADRYSRRERSFHARLGPVS